MALPAAERSGQPAERTPILAHPRVAVPPATPRIQASKGAAAMIRPSAGSLVEGAAPCTCPA